MEIKAIVWIIQKAKNQFGGSIICIYQMRGKKKPNWPKCSIPLWVGQREPESEVCVPEPAIDFWDPMWLLRALVFSVSEGAEG